MDNSFYIAELIHKKKKGSISEKELLELEQWKNEDAANLAVYEKCTDAKNQLSKLEIYSLFEKDKVWMALEDELFGTKTISLFSRRLVRYAAAILIPLMLGGTVFYLYNSRTAPISLADIDSTIKPGTQKAMLILSDGESVDLSTDTSESIQEENVRINNKNKVLTYIQEKKKSRKLIYNELKTPRGGGYKLTLADGTEVTLNAGSSIKFPVTFSDSTRKVYLTGEAYFDVAHNGKPFIVNADEMDIRVLGTRFNVSAYTDEAEIKTTLIEGKVRIDINDSLRAEKTSKLLAPNEQAVVVRNEAAISVSEVNASLYISWMEGKFEFNNESLDAVMRSLARWYDFEYAFENPLAKDFHFTARIDKESNISSILEMLELTTNVKFEVKNQTIVVL